MTKYNLDEELAVFDYSVFSAVRDSLLTKLIARHRHDNGKVVSVFTPRLKGFVMSEDELQFVAAAGVNDFGAKTDNLGAGHDFSSAAAHFGEGKKEPLS